MSCYVAAHIWAVFSLLSHNIVVASTTQPSNPFSIPGYLGARCGSTLVLVTAVEQRFHSRARIIS